MDFAVVWRANWVNKGFSGEKIVASSPAGKPYNSKRKADKQTNTAQIEFQRKLFACFSEWYISKLSLNSV